ncbi:monosaccharide ABC transporter substrate-binding protein (CUT2 family) [Lacrimispora xylanisolvens]|uniref:Monosaccharide ABC transporter substrate-binding protein (CUT2 family) n=1 Tax=Lacrimispora xylanisolvens TaxID=384636 RepID=A0A2S6HM04_9FIRM|nr:sugar ABC transporter substrate-binding protein [Hungatella xylanolytica]MBE5989825.1 ABC transporter substrate-binding protein [Paenibacillaceae bacterium]MBE5995593.1 ABC transporter substrate-binding protein [Paenibacillaceae bacterium]PPK78447.1 monosaccharide ABC transporter substrate-binding protein (CUT2 family) [Hungatella xylanolytica]
MKKGLAMVLAATLILSATGCGSGTTAATTAAETEKKTEASKTEETTTAAQKVADAQAAGSLKGKKVAVVRNLAAGDHTQQFLDGCVSEGKKFGWTVDTFVTDGDDAKAQETVAQVIAKGYDGLIVSHGQLSYSYDMLKPARDKGMAVVTFDTMPFKGGDANGLLLDGVTSTAQNDQALAELSLGHMMKEFEAKGGKYPMKVLKTFMGPGIPPLDRRNEIYAKLEDEGKIKTLEVIAPSDSANARGDMTNKTAAILPKYPEGSVDAIWGCYDELAKGVLQALNDAGRTDIPMYTIDVSNDDIQLMVKNPQVWKSTAAVDPKLIGIVDTRLLALKLLGAETPSYFDLNASNIETTQLSAETTMGDLGKIVDGWGDAEDPKGALFTDVIKGLYVE